MKKNFRDIAHKKHYKRVAERTLKRKRKLWRKYTKRPNRIIIQKHHHVLQTRKLTVPSHLSVIDNVDETLNFFSTLYYLFKNKKEVYLDLSRVTILTPEAILYLLSLFDIFRQQGKLNVSGNAPKDRICFRLLVESDFYNYVQTKSISKQVNDKILSIQSGCDVDSTIVDSVIQFSLKHLDRQESLTSRKLYTVIMECMGNTKEHAYLENQKFEPKWWLMAVYNEAKNVVNFSILDNGSGIPSTVRKSLFEIFREKFLDKFWDVEDHKLIQSALLGELRTRTKEPSRGRGLPKIHEIFENGHIANLVIISNKGFVNYNDPLFKEVKVPFYGTLFSWDFV